MPYANQYNASIAQAVRGYSQKHIDRENAINDFNTSYEIPSKVEASVLKEPEVHGGNGFAAATVADLGIEPTLGATGGAEAGVKRRARKKVIQIGEGLAAAGVSPATSKPKRARKKKTEEEVPPDLSAAGVSGGKRKKKGGALLSLKDLDGMHGQPADTIRAKVAPTAKPEAAAGGSRVVGAGVSGGANRSRRNAIVKEVMKKHGLSLPAASKYVKEHKLY
jgi:hypothetical protein